VGILDRQKSIPRHLAAHADAIKTGTGDALKTKAAEWREAIGPEKMEPVKQPERAFGREGGEDVKQVVWSGHAVRTTDGHRHYSAVGLTTHGYYRCADVQVYGAEEKWRWQPQRYPLKADAIGKAEAVSQGKLKVNGVKQWKTTKNSRSR
jgi:hypothetical protein